MRCLVVTEVAAALPDVVPFMPNYSVVVLNASATAEILESADAIAGTYATLATVGAGQAVQVVLNKPFVRLASAGFLVLLGN
jgi:hypothetical protein